MAADKQREKPRSCFEGEFHADYGDFLISLFGRFWG